MAARSCLLRRRFTLATFASLAFAERELVCAYNQETTSRRARQRAFRTRSSLSSVPVSLAAAEIAKLTHHKALWDESEPLSRARRKLKPRHRALFESDDASLFLFDEFCTVLCDTGVTPRKEIFETWSAALYIHETFGGQVRRVCDVAAGHSLLAWALLVLDDDGNNENEDKPLTVLCVDRRMPSSAEAIRLAMIDRWPHLEERFDFVEGSLEQLQPHPSCLLASVHACGGLSDLLIASAASSQSPIALVPCCHTRKKKALLGASDFARVEYDAIINADEVKDLTTMLDEAREAALRNAGFDICTQYLPKRFTLKNRVIMGMSKSTAPNINTSSNDALTPPGRMPPIKIDMSLAKAIFLSIFTIHCEDSEDARITVKELSGKTNADRRKQALHRKGNAETPTYDISFWLPSGDKMNEAQNDWEASLTRFASSIRPDVRCEAKQIGEEFINSSGRRARAFRMSYWYETDGNNEEKGEDELTNDEAKSIHREVYEKLPTKYPGTECR